MTRGTRGFKILTSFCLLIGLVGADEGRISDAQTQDNPCFGKHGIFLPSFKNCNEYLICVQGLPVINSCGDDHFDARRGVCDRPEMAACINSIFPPEVLPLVQTICLGKENGSKLPVSGNSSQYFLCIQGYAQLEDCGGLIFDKDVLECVGVSPKPPCSGVQNGARVPVSYDPRKYYLCMNNRAFIKSCGDLFFSAKSSSCSTERDVEYEVKMKKISVSIPLTLLTSAGVLQSQESPVQGAAKEPTLVGAHHIATIVKSRPVKVDVVSRPLARPVEPNPIVLRPPTPAVVTQSQVQETIKEPTMIGPNQIATITESRPERPLEPNRLALRICQGQKFGSRIPIPGTCSQYYICMGNTGVLKSCDQMQFNPKIAACDFASNVYCSVQQGVAVYGSKDTETDPKPQDFDALKICQGQSDHAFIPVPGNCSQFYFCFKNTAILKNCGNRHFNPITNSCVDLESSNCVNDVTTVKKPPAKVTPDINCLTRDNGVHLKHPTDCGKFLVCDNHRAIEMICPAGLHFSVTRDYCDWPDLAECS